MPIQSSQKLDLQKVNEKLTWENLLTWKLN